MIGFSLENFATKLFKGIGNFSPVTGINSSGITGWGSADPAPAAGVNWPFANPSMRASATMKEHDEDRIGISGCCSVVVGIC